MTRWYRLTRSVLSKGVFYIRLRSYTGQQASERSRLCRLMIFKGVMTRSNVDVISELCTPFLKGGNSIFIAAIASGLFPQNKYPSLE